MLVTLRDELIQINRSLTEAESARNGVRKAELLEQAVRTSARAIEGLLSGSELDATLAAAGKHVAPYEQAVRQTWEDAMLFQAFLEAEARLFRDLGLDGATADRLVAEIRTSRAESEPLVPGSRDVEPGLRNLAAELAGALEKQDREAHKRASIGLVRRGFLVVGGLFVVGANALVGTAAAPVTGGLSVAGAAVSACAGGVMVDRGTPS